MATKALRQFERRAAGAFPYYKLAQWNQRSFTYSDGKVAFATEAEAREAARKPGQYRVSSVHEDGSRVDGAAFSV